MNYIILITSILFFLISFTLYKSAKRIIVDAKKKINEVRVERVKVSLEHKQVVQDTSVIKKLIDKNTDIVKKNTEYMEEGEKKVNEQSAEALNLAIKRTQVFIKNMSDFKRDLENLYLSMAIEIDEDQAIYVEEFINSINDNIKDMEAWHFQWTGEHYLLDKNDDYLATDFSSKN